MIISLFFTTNSLSACVWFDKRHHSKHVSKAFREPSGHKTEVHHKGEFHKALGTCSAFLAAPMQIDLEHCDILL